MNIFHILRMQLFRLVGLFVVFLPLATPALEPTQGPLKLHVPSPDWRDQIIYFVMTDRFNDGDRSNNDQGGGEYDPNAAAKYSGGDLRGIEQRLDYIQGLGATAVWITPPVRNLWWHTALKFSGYHGYWATDFMAVDPHLGNLADYQRLSHALHSAGMYLVQDIVVNHTADFFTYTGAWDRKDPAKNFTRIPSSLGELSPKRWPFSLNDASDPTQRAAAIYHWTPDVSNYADRRQEHNFQMSGLDDLNTENPVVRRALRQSYGYWIDQVGVDAFRVDTAFYVPPAYFHDFLYARDPQAPGMMQVARATGRKQFFTFGEGFAADKPFASQQTQKIEAYVRAQSGQPRLQGMLNFPLQATAADVFARGHPTAELAYRIQSMMRVHGQPHLMPSFIDNHDMDRFLSGGSTAALQQNLLMLMTLPGIPVIYYGTEQGFKEPRAAMFKNGWGSGGSDHFDAQAPLYRYIQRVSALRRAHPLFSRGRPRVLLADQDAPGLLAYRMDYGEQAALVVFNTSTQAVRANDVPTGLRSGALLTGLFGTESTPDALQTDPMGRVHLAMPAQSGAVWLLPGHRSAQAKIQEPRFAAPAPFTSWRGWQLLANVLDPKGDDRGPCGHYLYPTDPTWGNNRQLDIHGVRVWSRDEALRVDVQLNTVTQSWNPANGFDHVAINLFIQIPGKSGGSTVLPLQNANLPSDMRWHYRLRAHGWSNALFSSETASPTAEGTALTPAAQIAVDRQRRTVSFMLRKSSLGGLKSTSGVKLYLTTWDYDGGYRELGSEPRPSGFGGASTKDSALVMDDTAVIELP